MPNRPTTIADCMRKNPLTISEDANIFQAVELIVEYKLTGLTVTDDAGCVVGILSEIECLQAILTSIYNDGDAEQALVKDVMQSDVVSCAPADGIVEVAQDMLNTRQRRRPVMVDGKLVGQVSSSNVLWALMEYWSTSRPPARRHAARCNRPDSGDRLYRSTKRVKGQPVTGRVPDRAAVEDGVDSLPGHAVM